MKTRCQASVGLTEWKLQWSTVSDFVRRVYTARRRWPDRAGHVRLPHPSTHPTVARSLPALTFPFSSSPPLTAATAAAAAVPSSFADAIAVVLASLCARDAQSPPQ